MTIPTDPSKSSGGSNVPPSQPVGPQPAGNIDPTGAWSKFLSTPGNVATPEEVKLFMQGLLKMFNVIIQQQTAAAHRAAEQMKKAEEGED